MINEQFREETFYLENNNGFRFHVRSFLPHANNPIGVLQIFHGMAEHGGRYSEFAKHLAQNGFATYIADHPGHGLTARNKKDLGVVEGKKGWNLMLKNQLKLLTHIRTKHTNTHVFLVGHSMGSILARHFTSIYPLYFKGLILSGPTETSKFQLKLGQTLTFVQSLFFPDNTKVKWFNRQFYNNFNKHFKSPPTLFEWISSKREEVNEYVSDPFCGFDCSVGFYRNLFWGIKEMQKNGRHLTFRKSLPILIFSGDQDPVGNFGKDAIKIHANYYVQGFHKLAIKVFGGRHEMLREENKQEVFDYVLKWLQEKV